MSPLAPTQASTPIITVTPEALEELLKLRADEPDADQLGLHLSIISEPGEDFRYDLAFEVVTKAAFTDEVRTHRHEQHSIKVIIPADDVDALNGATLDHTAAQGLVLRNPNRPQPPAVDGLTAADELSESVRRIVAEDVNPSLAAHGGFVTYVGHDGEGTVYMTMGGGCHGCSMSKMTMLDGVQTMLTEQLPEVQRVRDLTDHTTGANPFYR